MQNLHLENGETKTLVVQKQAVEMSILKQCVRVLVTVRDFGLESSLNNTFSKITLVK